MVVEVDLTLPLRRFVTLAGKLAEEDMQGRLRYERMPTFCYVCGIIEHKDMSFLI